MLVVPALDLSGTMPLTPCNVGFASGAVAIALRAHGVGLTTALTTEIAFHAVETVVGIAFGLASVLFLAPFSSIGVGKPQEVVVLALAGGLSVEVPMERAHELLRPLAGEADMSRVQTTLGAGQAANRDPWLKRRRDSLAKLTSGDPIELAEIIRDSAHRESTLRATQLSPSERDLFVKARQLLSNEIALARGI